MHPALWGSSPLWSWGDCVAPALALQRVWGTTGTLAAPLVSLPSALPWAHLSTAMLLLMMMVPLLLSLHSFVGLSTVRAYYRRCCRCRRCYGGGDGCPLLPGRTDARESGARPLLE